MIMVIYPFCGGRIIIMMRIRLFDNNNLLRKEIRRRLRTYSDKLYPGEGLAAALSCESSLVAIAG